MKNNPISFLDVCEYIESKNNSKVKKAIKYIFYGGSLMLPTIFSGYVKGQLINDIATGLTLAGTGIGTIVIDAVDSLLEDNKNDYETQYLKMQVIYYMCFYASFFDTVAKEISIEGEQDIWEGFSCRCNYENAEYLSSVDDNMRISFDSLDDVKKTYDFLVEKFRESFYSIDNIKKLIHECEDQKEYFNNKLNKLSEKIFLRFNEQIYDIGLKYESFRWWLSTRSWVQIEGIISNLQNKNIKHIFENIINDEGKKKVVRKDLFYRYKEKYFYLFGDRQCTIEDVFTLNNYSVIEFGDEDSESVENIEDVVGLVKKQQYLLVVGSYGSGKTTLLKKLYLEYKRREKTVYTFEAKDLFEISSYDKQIEFEEFFDLICEGETVILIDALDDLNVPSSQESEKSILEFFVSNMFEYMSKHSNIYFIISSRKFAYIHENDEESVADKIFYYTPENTKMKMIISEKFNAETVKNWIDNYPFLQNKSINKNEIKSINKKIMSALQNPLFLYIFIKQYEKTSRIKDNQGFYYYYEQFIDQTIKGKYFRESSIGASVIVENVDKYRELLRKIAYDILKVNSSQIRDIVNPMIIEEEQPLLNDVLQNYKFFISYNDFSETTKECFKDLKKLHSVDNANFLNCYFFKNVGKQVFFTDINILFTLAAERICEQLILLAEKEYFEIEDLKALDVIDFYPQIIDYIIYKLKDFNKLKSFRKYFRSFVLNKDIRNRMNVLEGNEKELEETFAQILMMYILFFKFNENNLSTPEYRHVFKEMIYYSNAYKTFCYQNGWDNQIFTVERYFIGNVLDKLSLNRVNLKNFNFKTAIFKNTKFNQCKFYDTSFFDAEICDKMEYILCEIKNSNMKFKNNNVENKIKFTDCKIDNVDLNVLCESRFIRCYIKQLTININDIRELSFEKCSIDKIIINGGIANTKIYFNACIFNTSIDLCKYKGKINIQTKCLKLADESLFKNLDEVRLVGSGKIS